MSGQVLALVVADEKMGYLVVDSRDGRPVSWHGDLLDANGCAAYLNSTYPVGVNLSSDEFCAPARDTLIFEVLSRRVGGCDPECLECWWWFNKETKCACPTVIPVGPGWDHIYEEVRR